MSDQPVVIELTSATRPRGVSAGPTLREQTLPMGDWAAALPRPRSTRHVFSRVDHKASALCTGHLCRGNDELPETIGGTATGTTAMWIRTPALAALSRAFHSTTEAARYSTGSRIGPRPAVGFLDRLFAVRHPSAGGFGVMN